MVSNFGFHGTSLPLLKQITKDGFLQPPVYFSTELGLAKEFSKIRYRFHPEPGATRRRVVLELDLTGFPIEPDPDPEANVPGSKYYGKLFRVMSRVPSSRIKTILVGGFPQDMIDADLARLKQALANILMIKVPGP